MASVVNSTVGPASVNLNIYRGDTLQFFFRLYAQTYDAPSGTFVKGSPINLTGYSFSSQIRADESTASSVIATLTATLGNQSDSINGLGYCLLSLPPSVTKTLGGTLTGRTFVKIGVWDVEVTEPNGTVTTLYAGDALVRPDVSRVP